MDTPIIDICIPTYEPNPLHLREALESLQRQTFKRWQVIIQDDASKNVNVAAIVHPFLSDARIRFIESRKRRGIGGNWNKCLKAGNTSFIAFLFQDDMWAPQYLERAVSILEKHPNVGFVSVEHVYRYEGETPLSHLYEELRTYRKRNVQAGLHRGREFLRWWIERELHPNVIGEPSFVVMRRSAVTAAGPFLKDMPQFLDVEYWTRLFTICDWYNLTENLGTFRVHPGGASAMNQQTGQGLFDRLRCFERLIAVLDGEDRKTAITARNRALESMVQKFFGRLKKGNRISTKGSGVLRSLCFRHPVLISKLIIKHFSKRPRPA